MPDETLMSNDGRVHHPSCSDIACTCPPRWHALRDAEARIAELEQVTADAINEATELRALLREARRTMPSPGFYGLSRRIDAALGDA